MNSNNVDLQMQRILDAMRARQASGPSSWEVDIATLRARARQEFEYWNAAPPDLPRIEELAAPGAYGPSRVRLYDPLGAGAIKPGLIYFHGGGWVLGDLELEDTALRVLARESGVAIFSVDYALAPEHRFPGPLDDCVCVSRWVRGNAGRFAVDPDRLALGGASAGANLALAAALDLRDAGDAWVRFVLLIHGLFATDLGSESHRRLGDGRFILTTAAIDYFLRLYLTDARERQDPRVALTLATLAGLPPVFMNAAELDPLLDDTLQMCDRLSAAGIAVDCRVYPGVIHGFPLFVRELDAAACALKDAGAALRAALR